MILELLSPLFYLAVAELFLLDRNDIVRWIDTDVRVQTHGADVLAKIGELGLDAK